MRQPPAVAYNPFDEATRADPYPGYQHLRDLAPVFRATVDGQTVYGLPRFSHVAAGLGDHLRFTARDGLGLYPTDRWSGGVIVTCDPPEHTRIRRAFARHMAPAAVASWRAHIQALADDIIGPLVDKGSCDATADLARPLVVHAVADFIGLPEDDREQLPIWADLTTNLNGPRTERAAAGIPEVAAAMEYLQNLHASGGLHPDRLGARLYEAAAAGVLTEYEATNLVFGMVVAGMHSSISFIGLLLAALARFPDQWLAARANPDLVDPLVDEALRYDTSIPALFRTAADDLDIDGYLVPAGARVMMMYAAANRDPRRWPLPDVLDASRFSGASHNQHLAFGAGNHLCLGAPLLRMEVGCLLRSLAQHRVRRIQVDGLPVLDANTIIRGYSSLPLRVHRE